jgi:GalNAc-alpha-(1->4)-GalNAc-alpha-(1->3)-diNAcBac-PP-undecaprenol alpha-1,4-N-acetyl-D-galactosaminyltransferase
MKIIFIIDSLCSGGAERVMSILANNLSYTGHQITILSKVHQPGFYELSENVTLVYPKTKINYRNRITTTLSRISLYIDIYKYLKNAKPDRVIPFLTTTNGTIIILCKLLGLNVIASEHNNFRLNLKSFPVWFIKRHIYPHANLITVLTERDKVEYYNKFMKNVVVMPNPLPLVPIEKVDLRHRDKIILSAGNLLRWEQKGFDRMLEIFSLIAPKYPEWQLHIAGNGDPAYLTEIILKLKIGSQVTLLGEVKDIQGLMQSSSIFALTSRWEGLPMVLLEAMSQGMACIAFDCFTGPGDLITNDSDGILVEDNHFDQFVVRLSKLIEDQELRLTLGTNAIEKSKKYLPEKIVERWLSIIENPTVNYE